VGPSCDNLDLKLGGGEEGIAWWSVSCTAIYKAGTSVS